jgi:hypothetical protein
MIAFGYTWQEFGVTVFIIGGSAALVWFLGWLDR